MEATADDAHIEYVQLLDSSDVYEQDTAEIMEIHEENNGHGPEMMHEIVTITDENHINMMCNYEEIQYVEAEVEIDDNTMINDDNHTVFIHDGRRYVIPNEQLNHGNRTIILDEEDGQLIQEDNDNDNNAQEEIEEDQQMMYYTSTSDIDNHNATTTSSSNSNSNNTQMMIGKQFAILKDGKLHLTTTMEEDKGMESKLREFESSLTNVDEIEENENNDEDYNDVDDNNDDSENQLTKITGKNLITGQTISLSGILEKMRRKNNVNDMISNKQETKNTQSQDYVLVPPVTRRVVVGRTQDGKRLVGKILQIQKKIQPNNDSKINQCSQNTFTIRMPKKRNYKTKKKQSQQQSQQQQEQQQQQQQQQQQEQQQQQQQQRIQKKQENQIVQLRYVTRTALDENIARTLAGLMDLESINKRLKGRRLIVRHMQRRSIQGKILNDSKRMAYYCGRLKRTSMAENWTFIQEYPTKDSDQYTIDLPNEDAVDANNKVNLRLSNDLKTLLSDDDNEIEEESLKTSSSTTTTTNIIINQDDNHQNMNYDDYDTDETITLYLTETQDEYGKKKTKVTIPQFATNQSTNNHLSSNKTNRNLLNSNSDHSCKYCGKKFHTLGSLKRHATVHDHSLRPLQCLTCLGRFTDESSLKKHMILHTGLRPHKCHMCDKTFAHRGDLNFHLRTHDPIKRYECHVCNKQFNRHSNMLRHAEIHRPQHNDKQSETDETSIQEAIIFNQIINEQSSSPPSPKEIYNNQIIKAPFTCDQCGIQYNFSSSLTRHIVNVHMKSSDS